MKTFTSGMLKTFSECPQKYIYIFEEHLEMPSEDYFSSIGKKLHALINYFFKGEEISKMLKTLELPENKDLLELWENFVSLDIKNVLKSEYTFNVILNDDIKFTGRLDAIRKTNNGLEILDWKTGDSKNINPETDPQTMVYMHCIYKLFKLFGEIDNPENLYMSYYFLKENICKTVNFSQDKYLEYEKILKNSAQKILKYEQKFPYPNEKCNFCSYKNLCKGTYEGLNDVL